MVFQTSTIQREDIHYKNERKLRIKIIWVVSSSSFWQAPGAPDSSSQTSYFVMVSFSLGCVESGKLWLRLGCRDGFSWVWWSSLPWALGIVIIIVVFVVCVKVCLVISVFLVAVWSLILVHIRYISFISLSTGFRSWDVVTRWSRDLLVTFVGSRSCSWLLIGLCISTPGNVMAVEGPTVIVAMLTVL